MRVLYLDFSVLLLISWALTSLCVVTHPLSPYSDPTRDLKCLKLLLLQQEPTGQWPYLAPVSCHPARRRAAAQTAADADRRFAFLWTLCSWECFGKVAALAQNNPMLESWTTFGSALERKQILMSNNSLKTEETLRKVFLKVNGCLGIQYTYTLNSRQSLSNMKIP